MSLQESADHWRTLAQEQRDWGRYESSRGQYCGVYEERAKLYERTAQSLEIQAKTGIAHCVCCLKPLTGKLSSGLH